MPGTSADVLSSMRGISKPPSLFCRWTFAVVSIEVGGWPARVSVALKAIVKHAACEAANSSSGFVPGSLVKRVPKE